MLIGSSDPRPSTGVEGALPRPLVGESAPPSPKRIEAPRPQEQEGAPEPPRSRVEEDPTTISDGSGGDRPSKDAHSMDDKVEASPTTKRTPWPNGLHSVTEQRKKEEEERERETRQQLQEGSSSRSRKYERKSGGLGDPCSRSCWSRTSSRSCGSSRSSNSRGVSS